jgi:hypothetical protein
VFGLTTRAHVEFFKQEHTRQFTPERVSDQLWIMGEQIRSRKLRNEELLRLGSLLNNITGKVKVIFHCTISNDYSVYVGF